MLLANAVKWKDELRDSDSQLKLHMNDLKASMCFWKNTPILWSCRTKITEKEIQNQLGLDEWQRGLTTQPSRVSTAKMRALTGREWDPVEMGTCEKTLVNLATLNL